MIDFIKKLIRSRKFWGFVVCIILAFLKILTSDFVVAYGIFCGANEYSKRYRPITTDKGGE